MANERENPVEEERTVTVRVRRGRTVVWGTPDGARFTSYPGDVIDLPEESVRSLVENGAVEIVKEE